MKLKVEYVEVEKLIEYEGNARTHSASQVAQITASIREFGFTNPVLIDENNEIIAGHGRLMAARSMGLIDVPAIRLVGLSEERRRALRIADNQIALNAAWDFDLLAAEVESLDVSGFDLDVLGFDDDFLDGLLDGIVITEEEDEDFVEEDDIPEPEDDPVTVFGDVWVMGEHRLMCGDSLNFGQAERLMGGVRADLFLTDPPYNVDYEGKTEAALTIENDSMVNSEFRRFLRSSYLVANNVMKPGAVFYVWHADSEGYNFRGAAKDVGWQVRQCLIWVKNSMVLGRQDYQWRHEPCLYGWKGGAAHFFSGDRKQSTVLEFDRPTKSIDHPTMKPVELFAYQIENSSKRGDIVLDLFGGSGTTLIACEGLNRIARLMEIDPRYVDVAVKRWQELTGKSAILEGEGKTFDELSRERPKTSNTRGEVS